MNAAFPPRRRHRLFIRKPVEQVQYENSAHALKRTLGPLNLIAIGGGFRHPDGKRHRGNPIPAILLLSYIVTGALIYVFYGLRHSKLPCAVASSQATPLSVITQAAIDRGENL